MNKEQNKSWYAGFIILLAKIGPKFTTVFLKLLKGVKLGKVGLAAGSLVSYSVLFSWKFAIALLSMIFLHELGHLLAMKQCGMKTKGIYLIPFFGGAAVAEGDFPSRGAESYIAIAGPAVGLAMSLGAVCLYYATDSAMWAAIAGWWALINLFNLFPVNPLDGGRIVKSIAFSVNSSLGIFALSAGLVVAILFSLKMGLGLLVFVGVIGSLELFGELARHKKGLADPTRRMNSGGIAVSLAGYLLVGGALIAIMVAMKHVPGADIAMQLIQD